MGLKIMMGTLRGPFLGVAHLVTDWVGALDEALPTFPTRTGPFPNMDLLVADQAGPPAEALLTF